jgi:hypothetical protein
MGASPPEGETLPACESRVGGVEAEFSYEPRREMVVDRTYEVQAILALDSSTTDGTFDSPTTIVTLDGVRCVVEARLTSGDFEIDPPEPQVQSFTGRESLVWRWQVRPIDAGDGLALTLRVKSHVREGGVSAPGAEDSVDAVIDVEARPRSLAERLGEVLGSPATGLLAVVVVPIMGWLMKGWWSRRGRSGWRLGDRSPDECRHLAFEPPAAPADDADGIGTTRQTSPP